jgi:hypothetical protein
MTVTLTDEQAKNAAASLRASAASQSALATLLDPPVTVPPPTPPTTPASTVQPLDSRFVQTAFTDFPGVSLPPDFYAYQRSRATRARAIATQPRSPFVTACW